ARGRASAVTGGGALVHRLDPSLALELHQLLPHRLARHAEALRELRDGERTLALQRLEDALTSAGRLDGHEAHPNAVARRISSVREQFSIVARPCCAAPLSGPWPGGRPGCDSRRSPGRGTSGGRPRPGPRRST